MTIRILGLAETAQLVEGSHDSSTMRFLFLCNEPVAISAPALATACSVALRKVRDKNDIGIEIEKILKDAAPAGFGETPGAYRLARFGFPDIRAYPVVACALLGIPEKERPGVTSIQVFSSAYVHGFKLTLIDRPQNRVAMAALVGRGISIAHEFI